MAAILETGGKPALGWSLYSQSLNDITQSLRPWLLIPYMLPTVLQLQTTNKRRAYPQELGNKTTDILKKYRYLHQSGLNWRILYLVKLHRKRQILYNVTSLWKLKNNTNECICICKMKTDPQIWKTNLSLPNRSFKITA